MPGKNHKKERQLIEILEKLVKMDEEAMMRNEQHEKEWQLVESQREIEQREKEYKHEEKNKKTNKQTNKMTSLFYMFISQIMATGYQMQHM